MTRLWPGPSLARRTVGVLLCAIGLVWLVLLARDFLEFRRQVSDRTPLVQLAGAVLASLPTTAADEAPVAVLTASDIQYNALRQGSTEGARRPPLLFHLETTAGASVYDSPDLRATGESCGRDTAPTRVGDRDYWRIEHRAGPWCLVVLDPAIDNRTALQILAADLLGPISLALPIVALPLWLAVRNGLRPLRAFADAVSQRASDDLTPLTTRFRHAELAPIGRAFDQLLDRAREAIARERSFVHDAAHELRTPLAVMSAEAHALLVASDDDERQRARSGLEKAASRASNLVHQMLELARLESPFRPEHPAPADLAAIIQDVLLALLPQAQARGVELALEGPDALPGRNDSGALHSVVENLVRNAIAYGRLGGRVLVRLGLDGSDALLSVADDGPGISPEAQARLFERFHRGAGADSPGAGLGLAIVREATRRLGGTLSTAEGLDGRGIAFAIRFPLLPAGHTIQKS
ncbi:MAG: HAMP domain-containing protein [Rhodocyclaceae bacterium]|nr:HAMP domain-containing protein [Rhodocyclaceae bacterium]